MTPSVRAASDVLAEQFAAPMPLGFPATAVWIDEDPDLPAAVASLRARQRVVVGVARGPGVPVPGVIAGCDILLAPDERLPSAVGVADPAGEADRVLTAIERNPHAVATLADVLRATESLPVLDALHVESMANSALLAG
ncbi:MAG: hypothetical protein ACTHON_17940 [Humibacter sp.]